MIHRYQCAVSGELKPLPESYSATHRCGEWCEMSDEERRTAMRADVLAMARRTEEERNGEYMQHGASNHYWNSQYHYNACREFAKELE